MVKAELLRAWARTTAQAARPWCRASAGSLLLAQSPASYLLRAEGLVRRSRQRLSFQTLSACLPAPPARGLIGIYAGWSAFRSPPALLRGGPGPGVAGAVPQGGRAVGKVSHGQAWPS